MSFRALYWTRIPMTFIWGFIGGWAFGDHEWWVVAYCAAFCFAIAAFSWATRRQA